MLVFFEIVAILGSFCMGFLLGMSIPKKSKESDKRKRCICKSCEQYDMCQEYLRCRTDMDHFVKHHIKFTE